MPYQQKNVIEALELSHIHVVKCAYIKIIFGKKGLERHGKTH